jgi:hypothetical protein
MSQQGEIEASRDKERAYHEMRISSSQNMRTVSDSVLYDMSALDSKSSALLQFISIVLVALTFALGFVDGTVAYAHWIRTGVFFFMICFAFAAWVDLRCLRSISPARIVSLASEIEYEDVILQEVAQRREKYLVSLRITEATFILLIPFIILWILLTLRAAHPLLP